MGGYLKHIELRRDTVPDFSVYPFSIPALMGLDTLTFNADVTFLVGENGSGKSTIIEAVAIKAGFNAEGGSKNFTGASRPSESSLHAHLRLARGVKREAGGFFLRAETMFNVSTEAEQYRRDGWEDLHEKSHGEAFLWVMKNRFPPRGLFLLDEPEAALSPQRLLVCMGEMHRLVRSGSQFIIATHSPILMAYPGAKIIVLSSDGPKETALEDTEHYIVTKAFLQNPMRMLSRIFEPDEPA